MKTFRKPLRPVRPTEYEPTYAPTAAGQQTVMPTEPIPFEVTRRGQGEYLPTQGKFREGEDDRRHTFTELECRIGGHVAAFTLLTRYADAYASTEEEWEALAAERMNTILHLRAQAHGLYIST